MAVSLSFVDYNATNTSADPSLYNPSLVVEYGANRYVFYIDGNNSDLTYRKSTNRGRTWGSKVVIHAATYISIAIWFDQWTPGDSGTKVHIWGSETGADDVNYFSLDISTDTLGNSGTAIVVFNGASAQAGLGGALSGAKARGGNLSVAFDFDGGTETGFYRSTDNGASWGSRSNPNEAASTDYYLLFPGNETDSQDMWLVFWDRSADEISLKTYDDSADSWSEQSIQTSMVDASLTTVYSQFAGTIRASDNHLLLAAWNSRDQSTSDLRTWDINGAGSITATTNIVTDSDDCNLVVLTLDANNNVHATYVGKSDGSETVNSAVTVNRKTSQDGMATWSSEYAVIPDLGAAQVSMITGAQHSETAYPFAVWFYENFSATNDALVGPYVVPTARAAAAVAL